MVSFKEKMKKLNFGFRIWILIIFILLSLISIFGLPPVFLDKGLIISDVDLNSTAFEQGFKQGMTIYSINNIAVNTVEDYSKIIKDSFDKNSSIHLIFSTNNENINYYADVPPRITLIEPPNTNIKLGLDLSGGSRALVKAKDADLSSQQANDLASVTRNRLNVYGLSDVNVNPVSDLSGNHFILVQIAGASTQDLKNLIESQGKFEAKISNETVFTGGNKDITSICRNDARCAYIDSCQSQGETSYCNFHFSIYLSESAANRHKEVLSTIPSSIENPGYLAEKLDLYVDNNLVDSLLISESLRDRITTQISISGSGSGLNQEEAYSQAKKSMNNLQTILLTGSLPYQLEIIKLDTISANLGSNFTKTILLAGILALIAVSIFVFLVYKKVKLSLAILLTSFSEVLITLGVASFIGWNLDLPSIAGILTTIGTGIDSQIVMLDESRFSQFSSLKQKLKRAFAIVLGSYLTTLAALFPLFWAVAGLFKGFAVTTIIGITIGILITRPAFGKILEKIEK